MMDNRLVLLLILLPVLWASCKKDSDGDAINPPGIGVTPELGGDARLNTFILAAADERLYQVDAQTGQERLITELEQYTDIVGLDYADGTVVFGDENNALQGYDLQSNTRKWQHPLTIYRSATSVNITPIIKDGVSYAAGDNGIVVATDIRTGTIKWHAVLNPNFESEQDYYSLGQITVTDDYVVVGSNSTFLVGDERNAVYVLNRSDGKGLAKITLTDGNPVTAASRVEGDRLYIPGEHLYAVDFVAGRSIWQYNMESNPVTSTPQLSGNMVVVQASEGAANGKLLAIDKNTGSKIWEAEMGNSYAGVYDPLIVNNLVIAVNEHGSSSWTTGNGRLTVVDLQSGQVRWVNDDISVGSNPVYANGVIYLYGHLLSGAGDMDDNIGLMAIDATSGTSMWVNTAFGSASDADLVVVAENGTYRAGHAQ